MKKAILDVKNIEEGSIALAAGLTATTNFVRRQVNFVYGEVVLSKFINVGEGLEIGELTERFRPKKNIYVSALGYWEHNGSGHDLGALMSNVFPDGRVNVSPHDFIGVPNNGAYCKQINFAYEITEK